MDETLKKLIYDSHYNSGFVAPLLKVDIPLYRYRGNLKYILDEISTGNIYLAPIYSLNDPFEATAIKTPDEIRGIQCPISFFWTNSFFLQGNTWTTAVRASLQGRWEDTVTLQEFADIIAQLVTTAKSYYPSEAVVNNYHRLCNGLDLQRRRYGNVACFSEKFDSLSMWSYYANSHKGVCLKYDFSLLDTERQENRNILSSIQKVWYSNVRHYDKDGSFSPFFKAQAWAHEQEWRLFRSFGEQYINLPCITEVYLGLDFDYENIDKIVEAIVHSGRDIELFQVVPSPNDFSLKRAQITYDSDNYKNRIKYNKLVRDGIPEIIEASGKKSSIEILSDDDYLKMIDQKLDEELSEYHQDQNIEELADLMEVIRAAAVARGYSIEELERVRAEKAAKRGGFEKKILLKEVIEE